MPWQNTGNFLRTNNQFTGTTVWSQDQQASIKIIASRHDFHDEDLATGIENCLNLDGYNSMRADIDMGGNTLINLAGGSLASEGQWTPQLVNPVTGANNSTMAAAPANFGWYLRSGRIVNIFCRIEWTASQQQSNIGMAIDGFPFTIDEPFAGAGLAAYASSFLAGKGMAVSGIGAGPNAVELSGGGSIDLWQPEAVIPGVIPIAAGVNYDPNTPGNVTAAQYIHLRSYFGFNNITPNGYGDVQYPYYYIAVEPTGAFGFQMTYLTDDPL